MRVRVQFLGTQEGGNIGQKEEIVVEVPHLTRAETVAREQGGFPAYRWALYGCTEVRE